MERVRDLGNGFLNKKSILFMGQKGCKNSLDALQYLKSMGCEVVPLLGDRQNNPFQTEDVNWQGDFIFSYRCHWLIKEQILNKTSIAAINFHPGTPNFPGSGAYSWALYYKKDNFGITIHLMNEKFDNGKILDVCRFKIDDSYDLPRLIKETYSFSLSVFKSFISKINSTPSEDIDYLFSRPGKFNWSGKVNKISDLDKMKVLTIDLDITEFERRIRSFNLPNFPIQLNHNGQTFQLLTGK